MPAVPEPGAERVSPVFPPFPGVARMSDAQSAFIAKKEALVVLAAQSARQVWQTLCETHWAFAAVVSLAELKEHDPNGVDCLVLDTCCQPLVSDILAWCEGSEPWRKVPKLLLIPPADNYNRLTHVSTENLEAYLRAVTEFPDRRSQALTTSQALEAVSTLPDGLRPIETRYQQTAVQPLSDRRQNFRYPCNDPVTFQQRGKLVDLSIGGALLETVSLMPAKTALRVCVSEHEPLLKALDAEVISCQQVTDDQCHSNLQFRNVTPSVERALQRYLLGRQSRRSNESSFP
jgi:hypothetical protein